MGWMVIAYKGLWAHRTKCDHDSCSGTERLNHLEQADTGLDPNAASLLKTFIDFILLLANSKTANKATTGFASNLQPGKYRFMELKQNTYCWSLRIENLDKNIGWFPMGCKNLAGDIQLTC